VIVNWNSSEYLVGALEAVRRFSRRGIEVLVVDNGSKDRSREVARSRGARVIRLPMNLGHGPAAEIGAFLARGEYLVVLDVDAFPISDRWLEGVLEPLMNGAAVAGAHMQREYAHPCCLAINASRFLNEHHTMLASYDMSKHALARISRESPWDVGELISIRERPNVYLLEATSRRGPGAVGMVFADVVYHNGYSTRHKADFPDGADGELDGARIRASDATTAWDEATRKYLGMSPAELLDSAGPEAEQP
jgi:glycosyltransferase involved in cell wall biosynthesis